MDAISEIFSRAIEQLLGRASGPLHLRLVIQPIMATILAIRAGLRDAREGQSVTRADRNAILTAWTEMKSCACFENSNRPGSNMC